jgi:hypothetical protein
LTVAPRETKRTVQSKTDGLECSDTWGEPIISDDRRRERRFLQGFQTGIRSFRNMAMSFDLKRRRLDNKKGSPGGDPSMLIRKA